MQSLNAQHLMQIKIPFSCLKHSNLKIDDPCFLKCLFFFIKCAPFFFKTKKDLNIDD
jgi:hypothetical protein